MFHANGVNGTAYGAKQPFEGGVVRTWACARNEQSAEWAKGATGACEGAEVLGARAGAKCLLARPMPQLYFHAQG